MAKSIQFSDSELVDLQSFYLLELEKAEKRVQELKNTLTKLGVAERGTVAEKVESSDGDENSPAKTSRKKKSKQKEKRPRWSEYVLAYLQSQNRLVRVGTIIEQAISHFEVEEAERKTTEQAIYNSLNRLQNVTREINGVNISGQRGRYYGLKDWFNEDGSVKEEYEQKTVSDTAD